MAFSIARFCMKSQPNQPLKHLSNYFVEIDNNAVIQNTYQQRYSTFSVNNFNKTSNKKIENHVKILCNNFSRQRLLSSSIRLESNNVKVPSLLSLQSDSKLLRLYSSNVGTDDTSTLSKKEKFKRAVKDYGATVIIFHVTISLMSLGCCYLVVASGLDVGAFISSAGLGGSSEIANEAGLFVIAYAIHKVFAPVRISITLAATPFIVRYLRKMNVLKTPKSKGV